MFPWDLFADDEAYGASWSSKTSSSSLPLSASATQVWNARANLCHNNVNSGTRRKTGSCQRYILWNERWKHNTDSPFLLSFDQWVSSDHPSPIFTLLRQWHSQKCTTELCLQVFILSVWYVHWSKIPRLSWWFSVWVTPFQHDHPPTGMQSRDCWKKHGRSLKWWRKMVVNQIL